MFTHVLPNMIHVPIISSLARRFGTRESCWAVSPSALRIGGRQVLRTRQQSFVPDDAAFGLFWCHMGLICFKHVYINIYCKVKEMDKLSEDPACLFPKSLTEMPGLSKVETLTTSSGVTRTIYLLFSWIFRKYELRFTATQISHTG